MVDFLTIATILMALFVAYQAWATHKMAKHTQQSIEEMRKEKEFYLMREHTRKIKERIVKPLLEEIKLINIKDCRPYRNSEPFKGGALSPEAEHPVLFEDFLRNHATQAFRENYKKFKEVVKELNEAVDDLERKLEEFFDKERLPVAIFEELGDEDCDRILKKEEWVFNKKSTFEFFIKYLCHKIKHPILDYIRSHAFARRGFIIKYKDNRGYCGNLECICDKEKLDDNMLDSLKKLLIEAQNKFAADVETIHEYVTQFNEVRNDLIRELERMEIVEIYKEKCEFVRFP
ncbi:hypothetical protein DRN44_06175 [Thermococci archaeon]|nr:MAG: hypothetical protein DRN44_06175 [Thermococci archaeon]